MIFFHTEDISNQVKEYDMGGNVARMGEIRSNTKFWSENLGGRD